MTRTTAAIVSLIAGLATGAAFAQSTATEPPLLSGPKVETDPSDESLVRRGFDGQMERTREQPELAALDLLGLSDEERAAVDKVLAKRAALVDGVVQANMETVSQLGQARRAQDREGVREATQALRIALEPVIEQGPLTEVVAAALPSDDRERFLSLIAEHHEATIEARRGDNPQRRGGRRGLDAMEAPGMGGPEGPGMDAPFELEVEPAEGDVVGAAPQRRRGGEMNRFGAMQSYMAEVRASYSRLVEDRQGKKDELDELLSSLDLTAEQQQAIEVTIREYRSNRTGEGEPSRNERMKLMRAIAEDLTPEQRRALRDEFRKRRG